MKLMHPALSSPIEFEENTVVTWVIENIPLFAECVLALTHQIDQGMPGAFVLSKNSSECLMHKTMLLVRDPAGIDLNTDKRLVNGMLAQIKSVAIHDAYAETSAIESQILSYAYRLFDAIDYPLSLSKSIDAAALMKCFGLEIEQGETLLERCSSLMRAAQAFMRTAVVVFVGLKAYLTPEALTLLYQDAFTQKLHLLLLEPTTRPRLAAERVIITDPDLCEIRYP